MLSIRTLLAQWKQDIVDLPVWLFGLYVAAITWAIGFQLMQSYNLGFTFDTVVTQYTWAQAAGDQGVWQMWRSYPGFLDYIPGSMVFLSGIYYISELFGHSAQAFVTCLKLTNGLGDFFFGILLYGLSLRANLSLHRRIFLQILAIITPAIWMNSLVWGQMDIWSTNLSLVSWICLQYGTTKKHAMLAGFWYFLSISLKLQAILFLPLLIITALQKVRSAPLKMLVWQSLILIVGGIGIGQLRGKIPESVLTGVTIALFVAVAGISVSYARKYPSVLTQSLVAFWGCFAVYAAVFATASLGRLIDTYGVFFARGDWLHAGAANIWSLFQLDGNSSTLLAYSPAFAAKHLSTILLVLTGGFIAWQVFRHKYTLQTLRSISTTQLIWMMTALTTTYYFFSMTMHARYLHTAIIFSLVLLACQKDWTGYRAPLLIMHAAYTINLFQVYHYFTIHGNIIGANAPIPWLEALLNNTPLNFEILSATGTLVALYGILALAAKARKQGERELSA
jgi:hypothetical protein